MSAVLAKAIADHERLFGHFRLDVFHKGQAAAQRTQAELKRQSAACELLARGAAAAAFGLPVVAVSVEGGVELGEGADPGMLAFVEMVWWNWLVPTHPRLAELVGTGRIEWGLTNE